MVIIPIIIMIISFGVVTRLIVGTVGISRSIKNISKNKSKLQQEIVIWCDEIKDEKVLTRFVSECLSEYLKDIPDNWSYDVERKKIREKWHMHIPSLHAEMRNEKIKNIIGD